MGKRETDAVFEIPALRGLDAVLTALGKVKGGEEAGEPLRQAVGALETMGLADFAAVDLTIVRGLAVAHEFEPEFERALERVQDHAATVIVTGSFHTVGDALARLPGFAPVG